MGSALVAIVIFGCSGSSPSAPAPAPRHADAAVDAASPVDAAPIEVTVAGVGDLMLGSTYPTNALPPNDGADLLAEVTPLLASADVAFGNLEAPLFDGGTKPTCTAAAIAEKNHGGKGSNCWSFRMPERYATLLHDAGFDVVSIANNHIDDFGAAGRARTIEVLDRANIAWSGPTGTVAHLTVRGLAIDLIAFATYDGLNDLDDRAAVAALVAKSTANIVIVSFHGGAEGAKAQHVPDGAETFFGDRRGAVKAFAHAAIDAGADLVIGHGPHVVRGMEIYQGRLIAYSLGTFASYRGIGVAGVAGRTLVLEVRLGPDGRFLRGRIHAARQVAPGGPRLDPTGELAAIVRELSRADFGEHAVRVDDAGALAPE